MGSWNCNFPPFFVKCCCRIDRRSEYVRLALRERVTYRHVFLMGTERKLPFTSTLCQNDEMSTKTPLTKVNWVQKLDRFL